MASVRKYQGPVLLFLVAWLILAFPWIAAFFVSSLIIMAGLFWIKLIHGHDAFVKHGRASGFEEKFYQKGEPGFKNMTVTIFDYYKKE